MTSVRKTNRLVIVEEQWPCICFYRNFVQCTKDAFDYLDAPIRRITAADAPLHYAHTIWWLPALPDIERTVKLVKEVMYLKIIYLL